MHSVSCDVFSVVCCGALCCLLWCTLLFVVVHSVLFVVMHFLLFVVVHSVLFIVVHFLLFVVVRSVLFVVMYSLLFVMVCSLLFVVMLCCLLFSVSLQALQYLRKVCNHPALVLTPRHPMYERVMEHLTKTSSSLRDIKHATKLLALK